MTILRAIGDVHGCINTHHPRKGVSYRDIIKGVDYSVQLGDMGFNYSGLKGVGNRHMFIPGNHDNYDRLGANAVDFVPNTVDYGPVALGPFVFFAVRGEWSIDIRQRIEAMNRSNQKIWWNEEELSKQEMESALNLYEEVKPSVMMTHGCPLSISEIVGSPGVWKYFGWDEKKVTNTQYLLEYMLQTHQPKLWLFGHYHRDWTRTIGDTTFMCIDELNYVDFNEQWEVV